MKNKQEHFDIKNKKIHNLSVESTSNISYIIDKNQVQQNIKQAKLKLQKWKNNKKKYRKINSALEFILIMMLLYGVAGWIVIDSFVYLITMFCLFIPMCAICVFLDKFKRIFEIVESGDYRKMLDEITLFGDLKPKDFVYVGVSEDKDNEKMVNFKYIYKDNGVEHEKKICFFKIIKSDDIKEPVLVFDRLEYYIPK